MADDLSDRKDLAASSPAGSSAGSQAGDEAELQRQEGYPAWTGKRKWYRSTFTQITILGVVSFLAPGLWGATASLGAGGTQSPELVNAANSALFCCMVVTGLLTPTLVHLTSIKTALIIGGIGYAPYAAALATKSKGMNTDWFIIFGAILCGLSAGILWASEGAIVLAYPEREKQGKYLSYWLSFRVLGQFVGGLILLVLNSDRSEAGTVSVNTYWVFVALQALAPFAAMFLSLPHKVQRADKTPVYLHINTGIKEEFKNMIKLLGTSQVLLILPYMWQGTFSEALIGTYAVSHFTVRSRALGSFLSAIIASLGCIVLGFYLDNKKVSINMRGRTAFAAVCSMQAGWWVFAIVIMNRFHKEKPTLDWEDGSEWSTGFAVYLLLQLGFNLQYEFMYYIIGTFNDSTDIVRLASILRATESAGQAVSYGINSTSLRLDAVASINFILFMSSLYPVWRVIRKAGYAPDGTKLYAPLNYTTPDKPGAVVAAAVGGAAAGPAGAGLATERSGEASTSYKQ